MTRVARAALCAAALTLFACSQDGVLEVRIVIPSGQDPFANAVVARFTVGTTPPVTREFPISQGQVNGDLSNAPINVSAPLTVELVDSAGTVVARGLTPPIPLSNLLNGYVEIFVARVGAFAALPSGLAAASRQHAMTVTSEYEVVIAGGLDRNGTPLARVELYNLYAFAFVTVGNLVTPRAREIVLPAANGKFVLYGGLVGNPGALMPTNLTEVFDDIALTFTGGQGAGEARAAPSATPFPGAPDHFLIAGGDGAQGALASALIYDSTSGGLTAVGKPMQGSRRGHSGTPVQAKVGARILLYGGADNGPEAELFDRVAGTFSAAPGSPPGQRRDHTATLLADGRVLIAGGRSTDGTPQSDLVLYDPQCDDVSCPAFTTLDLALLAGRYGHVAHALSGNRVLLAGGRGTGDAPLSSAEVLLYDPTLRRMSREDVPQLTSARADFASVDLPTGQVLFVGGVDATGVPLSSAELFNPR
jgi:hypothetical protein